MSELDVINSLMKKLSEYEIMLDAFKSHSEELHQKIEAEQFITKELAEAIRADLDTVEVKQKEIEDDYGLLDLGTAPDFVTELREMLNLRVEELDAELSLNTGDDEPQSMFITENKDILKEEVASGHDTSVSLKDFKSDMGRLLLGRKLECLVEAYISGGYTVPGIAAMKRDRHGEFKKATDMLYQIGYLKRFAVDNMGEYYALSDRGLSAFSEDSALKFINHYMKYKVQPLQTDVDYTMTNASIIRLLAYETYIRQSMLKAGYRFSVKYAVMGPEYFVQGYPDQRSKYTIWFAGVASEGMAPFEEMLSQISESYQSQDILIIVGTSIGQAKAVAMWLKSQMGDKIRPRKLGYCRYNDVNIFEL